MFQVDNEELKDVKYLDVGGRGCHENFMSFVIDEMCVEDKVYKSVRVAVAMKNFESFDCILHSEFV